MAGKERHHLNIQKVIVGIPLWGSYNNASFDMLVFINKASYHKIGPLVL